MSLLTHVEISASLLESVKKTLEESNEYQKKVQAHMAKKGIKSLNDLTDDQKKKFFNELDAMHKAKNEEVELEEGLIQTIKNSFRKGMKNSLVKSLHPDHSHKYLEDIVHAKNTNDLTAIAKKAKDAGHLKSKNEEVEAVEESFSDAQISQLRGEMSKISGIDPASPTYKKLVDMLNNMGMKELTKLADANIKFISGLARNRVIRAGMKKEEVELEEAPYMGKGNHRPGWMLRADPELAKKFKEKEDAAKNRKKYMGKTSDEIAKMKKEEVELDEEQLNELDKSTLASYIKKRSNDVATMGAMTRKHAMDSEAAKKDQNYMQARKSDEMSNKAFAKGWKHRQNIAKAVDKLTKEELEFIESLNAKESSDE